MPKNSVSVSLDEGSEYHNIFKNDSLGMFVRPSRTAHFTTHEFPAGTQKIIYGFSLESQNTTEVWHYIIFDSGILVCYNEEFQEIWRLSIAAESANGLPDASIGSFTHAVSYNQFIINSEYLTGPIYGYVGGGAILASKVASINPDTTALELLPGGVATFGDRIVYSYYNQIFINDPGVDPRTIVAENAIAFEGKVLDMFQAGPQGNFYVITTESVYVLPADGLAGQQSYSGFISRIRNYEGTQLRNCGYSKGTIFGLVDNGVWDINNSINIEMIKYRRARKISNNVGNFLDFRYGRMYSYENGFIISLGGTSLLIDLVNKFSTWIYSYNLSSKGSEEIVGVLKTRDGKSIFASQNGVWEFSGNTAVTNSSTMTATTDADYSGQTVWGIACKQVETPPELSPVVRQIITSSDNHGRLIKTYIRKSEGSTTTPGALSGAVIGTDLWDTSGLLYGERKMRSVRHQRAVRGDSLDMEVAMQGPMSRINKDVSIGTNGQGVDRPSI